MRPSTVFSLFDNAVPDSEETGIRAGSRGVAIKHEVGKVIAELLGKFTSYSFSAALSFDIILKKLCRNISGKAYFRAAQFLTDNGCVCNLGRRRSLNSPANQAASN